MIGLPGTGALAPESSVKQVLSQLPERQIIGPEVDLLSWLLVGPRQGDANAVAEKRLTGLPDPVGHVDEVDCLRRLRPQGPRRPGCCNGCLPGIHGFDDSGGVGIMGPRTPFKEFCWPVGLWVEVGPVRQMAGVFDQQRACPPSGGFGFRLSRFEQADEVSGQWHLEAGGDVPPVTGHQEVVAGAENEVEESPAVIEKAASFPDLGSEDQQVVTIVRRSLDGFVVESDNGDHPGRYAAERFRRGNSDVPRTQPNIGGLRS